MRFPSSARTTGGHHRVSSRPRFLAVIVAALTMIAGLSGAASGVEPRTPGRAGIGAAGIARPSTATGSGAIASGGVGTGIARPTVPTVVSRPDSYSTGHLSIGLTKYSSGFSLPVFITHGNDGANRLFVVEQHGRIKTIQNGVRLRTVFLDISSRVSCCGERGLLGLAFDPDYKTNGKFYVDYTDVHGDTVVAEYHRVTATKASTSERVLLHIDQPFANHNGGMLAFGADGCLYIGMGDGGDAGDPGNRAQNTSSELGKILRINADDGQACSASPANPFVGGAGDDLVWAYGLRNPWRFSFDRSTHDLWVGDVGQGRYEEVDRATQSSGGGRGVNYGWRVLEGRACYSPSSGCSTSGKTMPLAVYSHNLGCAVTGGYVYRGSGYPAMYGAYIFGDYCSGRIWAVRANGPSSQSPSLLRDTSLVISSFGQGGNGILYVLNYSSGTVYRISGTAK